MAPIIGLPLHYGAAQALPMLHAHPMEQYQIPKERKEEGLILDHPNLISNTSSSSSEYHNIEDENQVGKKLEIHTSYDDESDTDVGSYHLGHLFDLIDIAEKDICRLHDLFQPEKEESKSTTSTSTVSIKS